MKSNLILWGACALLTTSGTMLHAENLLKNGSAETANTTWSPAVMEISKSDKKSGEAAFSLKKSATVVKSELIGIDPAKKYQVSGFLKSADPKNLSTACFGLAMFDKNKQLIIGANVDAVENSDTELAADAEKGATSLLVKDAQKWNKRRSVRSMVAFNTKTDLGDLPNFNLSPLVERVKKTEDGAAFEIKLKAPLTKAYKAGTPVRQHLYSSSLDCCLAYRSAPAVWTAYRAEFQGEAPFGASRTQFWKGTKFVAVYLMADASRKNAELLADDILLEEVTTEK